MAIIARIFIDSADQSDHDRLQNAVESHLAKAGGPPEGLMAHLGYPSNGGFLIVEAWRSDHLFQAYMNELLRPALAESSLTASEPEISPAWSIARP